MKSILQSVLFTFVVLSFTAFTNGDPEATAIIKKSEENFRGLSSKGELDLQIVRPDWSRTISIKSWAKGEDYSLMLITGPARDKGMAFLKREKEIWNWQPTIERVIKLPPSMMMQSWMGSDFTNDDLVRQSSIVTDYEHTLTGEETIEGRDCHVIELVPNEDAAVVWGKVKMWVDKTDFIQMKVEFYDEDEYLVNTMFAYDVKDMGGRTIPSRMEIIPAEEDGNKTVLVYKSLSFDVPIEDSFFSVQNMKRVK